MLIMKDPKSAIYVDHNLVWYQCKQLHDLGLVIALCSMEISHTCILQDFWYRPFKTARILKEIHKSVHHYMINVILLDIYRLARQTE